jgi:putative flippase GtrA
MNVSFNNKIRTFLDFFYPIVNRLVDKQTYYYIACGGTNTLLGLVIFYVCENFVFHQKSINIGFEIHAHIAAFIISFSTTFPIGFYLSKYIVWDDSELAGKKQLFRHLIFVLLSVFMNYGLLKLFVEAFNWWPFPSQFLTTCIIVVFSYITQKFISFK